MPGIIVINVAGAVNQPPSQVGNNIFTVDYGVTKTFSLADFTTGTTPVYADPEGDAAENVRILTLPSVGQLLLSAVPVLVNDVIAVGDLGNLDYVPDNATLTSYVDNFTFEISDVGSSTYTGTGIMSIQVNEYENQPPTVGNLSKSLDYGEVWVITEADLTTLTTPAYSDPEGDNPLYVKVVVVPTSGVLDYNGSTVVLNDVIPVSDINLGLLTYQPNLAETGGDSDTFQFTIADDGSYTYSA